MEKICKVSGDIALPISRKWLLLLLWENAGVSIVALPAGRTGQERFTSHLKAHFRICPKANPKVSLQMVLVKWAWDAPASIPRDLGSFHSLFPFVDHPLTRLALPPSDKHRLHFLSVPVLICFVLKDIMPKK